MAGNRLLVFARRPAPVQVTYLAYCSTTGMDAIDYRLTDPYLDPDDANAPFYSEQSIRLPRCYWCYRPMTDLRPGDAPARSARHITFGCLNNFSKVSPAAIGVWRNILRQVPNSHLLLHALPGSHRQRVIDFFSEAGIEPARIEFVRYLSLEAYHQTYQRIDIALDPFPYAGGTTTCDALWMGVPVVNLAGQMPISRSGLSLLTNVGLPELVTTNLRGYEETAVDLANDPGRLGELRVALRDRMRGSPLMDETRFAADIEAAYRGMWKQHCRW
jgi:protein O-GlcNAc transferase